MFTRIKPCDKCTLAEKLEHAEKKCRACMEIFKEDPEMFRNKDSCLYGGEDWVEQINLPSSTESNKK